MTLHRYALSSRARTVFDDVKCEFSYKVSYIYVYSGMINYQRTIASRYVCFLFTTKNTVHTGCLKSLSAYLALFKMKIC